MVHRSPVRKFAKASEGVGHRHKLPKLVEVSNNLISLSIPIQGHGQARRMPVTRNAPFSLVFSAIRKENYQYVFRGKVMIFIGFIQSLTVKSSQIHTTYFNLYHHFSGTICNSRIANLLVDGAAGVDYPTSFFTFGSGDIAFLGEIVNLLLNG